MARTLVIEEESGTCSGFLHPHNGYYAGDFHRAVPLPTAESARSAERASANATVLQMVTGVPRISDHTQPRAA
jgi:hypothetical protein